MKAASEGETMKIVFVGAGRLATNFATALRENGHSVVAVWSRTMESAQALACKLGAEATNRVEALPCDADAYVMAVKDDALEPLALKLLHGREQRPVFHTAGSVPMSVLGLFRHHGVVYPMQTFSKDRQVDFSRVPIFIEASTDEARCTARRLATAVSTVVQPLDSNERRYLHLAAVFACNFTNHCYALAAKILEQRGLDFTLLEPLMAETQQKAAAMHPRLAQTGPAIRYDQKVIGAQSQLLAQEPTMRQVYELMSKSINELAND